jgi:DNA repair protein RadC
MMNSGQPFRRVAIRGLADLLRHIGTDMAARAAEQLRVLFLDQDRILLADAVMAEGGVDEVTLPLRAIVHRALDLGAAGLVLAHNHPSGNPDPSAADLDATRQLIGVCRPLDILVLDHLIVAEGGWRSFRAEGLM